MFSETRYLLSQRNNPNSRVRADGNRWWGYPSRSGSISCIVVHTTENSLGDGVAMNVARWQGSTAPSPSSYHKLVDTHNIVQTVRDDHTAFHAVGFNSRGLGLSFATRAADWGKNSTADTRMLERGAWVAAQWCKAYNIPVRWISKAQGERGVKGLITHASVDPGRRSDPGANFPHDRFLKLIEGYMDDKKDDWEVFMMEFTDKEKEFVKRMAQQAVYQEDLDGQSFIRQFMIFHRDERPHLTAFIEGLKSMNSSAKGIGRAFPAMWREAQARGWLRDFDRFLENKNYSESDLD